MASVPKDGVYKLKERIKNPKPSGDYKLWTACNQIPPGESENDWPYRDLDEFLIVIQDVDILGRSYKEAVLANGYMTSGFYIGQVPSIDHFPGTSEKEIEEDWGDVFYSHSDEPAPQEFLDALVPAEGKTLEEILLMYGQHEGIDPHHRLWKESWISTVFTAISHGCRNDPELREKVETSVRRLLIRDGHRRRETSHGYDENGNIDQDRKKRDEEEETRRLLEVRNQQHKAFMEFDRQTRER